MADWQPTSSLRPLCQPALMFKVMAANSPPRVVSPEVIEQVTPEVTPEVPPQLIAMTQPDRPRSSKQRYRLTEAGLQRRRRIEAR
jgi:hypothetical protein